MCVCARAHTHACVCARARTHSCARNRTRAHARGCNSAVTRPPVPALRASGDGAGGGQRRMCQRPTQEPTPSPAVHECAHPTPIMPTPTALALVCGPTAGARGQHTCKPRTHTTSCRRHRWRPPAACAGRHSLARGQHRHARRRRRTQRQLGHVGATTNASVWRSTQQRYNEEQDMPRRASHFPLPQPPARHGGEMCPRRQLAKPPNGGCATTAHHAHFADDSGPRPCLLRPTPQTPAGVASWRPRTVA